MSKCSLITLWGIDVKCSETPFWRDDVTVPYASHEHDEMVVLNPIFLLSFVAIIFSVD